MKAARLSAAIVQTKPAKGRYAENLQTAREAFAQLAERPPDLVVFPEAAFTGYFLEGGVYDLALPAKRFADDLARTWRDACGTQSVDIVSGFYENDEGTYYNSAIYLRVEPDTERVVHVHRKMFLPTYGVFDEERFLSRGRKLGVFETGYGKVAMLICEDAWHAIVPTIAAVKGARVLIVPSASPGRGIDGEGELSSITQWRDMLRLAAAEHGVFVLYAGLTGFEGGKGMTGSSCAIDPRGVVLVQAPPAEPTIVRADLDLREIDIARASLPLIGDLDAALPDLLLDEELPLPRGSRDVPCR
ncbi:MAG: beta-ureidopropionase [Candidatus Eremiobacteraeota bacterium]|nr:beta-ureidopropionase [Candidatus Eremiobacteraeota bacterium]MBV8584463.1 beta-ureidopropionase [Candidatus Eremiobacteraeota bacterium]